MASRCTNCGKSDVSRDSSTRVSTVVLISLLSSLICCGAFAVGFGWWVSCDRESLFARIQKLEQNVLELSTGAEAGRNLSEHLQDIESFTYQDVKVGPRAKRSVFGNSKTVVDVGSVFVTAIQQICKDDGQLCLPGPKGEAGITGAAGAPGVKGMKGSIGRNGLDGSHGVKGLPGKQGPKGSRGLTGTKGEKGLFGPKGEKGNVGIQGIRGANGLKGEKGDKGSASSSPLPSQCHKSGHTVLRQSWRTVTSPVGNLLQTDREGRHSRSPFKPGWHSFDKVIGGAMPEKCPPIYKCGTNAPGWLKGSHPENVGQTVSRTVCFHFSNNCCRWQNTVEVTNCGDIYVYHLPNTAGGAIAYCARGN